MSLSLGKGNIIKGKPVADQISAELIKEVEELGKEGITPKLAIVRVGFRGDDLAYERGALKRCQNIGIDTEVVELDENITQQEFVDVLRKVNSDKTVNGILCFRPLPKQLDENEIKYVIDPEKDVDCFNPINFAKVVEGDKSGFPPCTAQAVLEILKFFDVKLKGKKVTVIGRSNIVGKPAAMLLLAEHATVTMCHSRTTDLAQVASDADVLVAAVGKAKMVKSDFVKEGAVVIDVGINVTEEGNLCGDVDIEQVIDKVSMITPVPAGVGSVTTSILAKHVVKACKLQK